MLTCCLPKWWKVRQLQNSFPPSQICLKASILLPSVGVQFATTFPLVNTANATFNYTFQQIQFFPKVKLHSLKKGLSLKLWQYLRNSLLNNNPCTQKAPAVNTRYKTILKLPTTWHSMQMLDILCAKLSVRV